MMGMSWLKSFDWSQYLNLAREQGSDGILQAISLVFKTGEMQTITREEWENGDRF
jgi:hypothetical protein